jgi:hypothetical protein
MINFTFGFTVLWWLLTTPQQKFKIRKMFLPCITPGTFEESTLANAGVTARQSTKHGQV